MTKILLALALLSSHVRAADDSLPEKVVAVLSSSKVPRPYFGSRLTMELKELTVKELAKFYEDSYGLRIGASEKAGVMKVSLITKDLPWDQALDVLLQKHGLKARLHGGAVQLLTIDEFNKLPAAD